MWDDYAGLPPFRRGDAARYGLTDADVRRLLSHGVLVRLAHGLLTGYRRVELAVETPQQVALRAQALQHRYPHSAVGLQSAAVLHRLWLIGGSGPVRLLRESGYPRCRFDVMVETAPLPSEHLTVVEGVVATTAARTAADLIARLPGGEALAILDSGLRAGVDLSEVRTITGERCAGGSDAADRILTLADARSQSALESVSRWAFHLGRLPPPELQVLLGDDDGPFALVDFLWREQAVIGEADGLLKYDEGGPALRAEKKRQQRLEALGFVVVRWGFEDITRRPHDTVARIRDALTRGAAPRRRAG
jgi:hypothetical protein